MDYEILFALAFGALCACIFWAHRRSVRLEKERHERVMREIEENNERLRQARAERRSRMAQYAAPAPSSSNRVNETSTQRRRFNDDRTMIYTDTSGEELLTQMILQNALNSSSDTVSGSVRWDNDTPTITPTPSYSPSSYESSSSSSYSSYSSDSSSSYSSSDSGSSSSSCD